MSDESPSTKSQINTELAIRATNRKVKRVIKEHIPEEEHQSVKIDFYCECSDPSCRERVSLSLDEYEKLHNKDAHFVIAKGHITPAIEKVVKNKPTMEVVEKYAL
jgi:hypothetical protein